MPEPLTLLCIATYVKGQEFMREAKRLGCRVVLLTLEKRRVPQVRERTLRTNLGKEISATRRKF